MLKIENRKKLYVACDQAGLALKNHIILKCGKEYEICDFATQANESDNYNQIAEKMLTKLQSASSKKSISKVEVFGVLICKNGTEIPAMKNGFKNVRARSAVNVDQVCLAGDNNANLICFSELTDFAEAISMLRAFTEKEFDEGRRGDQLVFNTKKYINLNYVGVIPKEYCQIKSRLKHFPCGELEFSIGEDLSGQEVVIFQSFNVGNFNDDIMKLQIVCDVLKRNNVKKISYFAPFLPYTRQDKTYDTSCSLGSKLVANIINNCGIDEVTTYDLHAIQIESFFNGRVNHLSMVPKFIEHIKSNFDLDGVVIVFPDAGSALRLNRFFAQEAFQIAVINKTRSDVGIKMNIIGNVRGAVAIILDDMIDGGGTICEAAKLIMENCAKSVFAYATHGIFSGDAVERINSSQVKKIVVANTLAQVDLLKKVDVLYCE